MVIFDWYIATDITGADAVVDLLLVGKWKEHDMLKFACQDVGVNCDFVTTGESLEEVREKAFAHAGVVHAELMKSMNEEQLAQLNKTVEAAIKPV